MIKLLLVGDCHAVPEELDDCRALIGLVQATALANDAQVVFLGDQYNTHNLIQAHVMWFWRESFRSLVDAGIKTHALVGNHDLSGKGQLIHAMSAHEHIVQVVDKPTMIGPVQCMPFYDDDSAFVHDANATHTLTSLVHQTFTGADYGGGFYAPDGVDPNLLQKKHVISGHIHTPSSIVVPGGPTITYIGAPRWRTLSDANIDRAIWLYEFSDDGDVISKTPFDTGLVCRQIKQAVDNPAFPLSLPLASGVDWRIDIHGPAEWIEKRKTELAGPGVKIRSFKTSGRPVEVRESEGISTAFRGYMSKYIGKHGTPRERLTQMAAERLHV